MNNLSEFLQTAARIRPSRKQMKMLETEFYAFFHFGVNTFTGREWGTGEEDPAIFNPAELDCDSWVSAIKSAGMKGAVLTAKHHDGFCLWKSRYTEHCVKNSPFKNGKGDVVLELAQACERGGIKFGFYLSPWDRNNPSYGTPEYNIYYKNQLTELLTQYGEIFHVWFDGACGEGPNGRRQEYDFDGYIELIHKYQPNAAIFNDFGPDIRWVGNEDGAGRYAEWAVVPSELCFRCRDVTPVAPLMKGDLSYMYNWDSDIGSLSNIIYSKGLVFCPSEMDMSIRPGWFYHPEEEPHSLERLFNTYLRSVGGNTTFNLNVPPMPNGLLDPKDTARLEELGKKIRESFAVDLVREKKAEITREDISRSQSLFTVRFPCPVEINYITLMEDIEQGQRVESFHIETIDEDSKPDQKKYGGTTIGYKKICPVKLKTKVFRVRITSARDRTELKKVEAY